MFIFKIAGAMAEAGTEIYPLFNCLKLRESEDFRLQSNVSLRKLA
jgi:hypothetical protein